MLGWFQRAAAWGHARPTDNRRRREDTHALATRFIQHMGLQGNTFMVEKRRVWMRMRDHAVVFERDPGFARFLQDESGSVLQVLRVWALYPVAGAGEVRRYIGIVRRWEGRGWVSHRELLRLFRRATGAARYRGEDVRSFRAALGRFLREKLSETG